VTFVSAWEADAPITSAQLVAVDPTSGKTILSSQAKRPYLALEFDSVNGGLWGFALDDGSLSLWWISATTLKAQKIGAFPSRETPAAGPWAALLPGGVISAITSPSSTSKHIYVSNISTASGIVSSNVSIRSFPSSIYSLFFDPKLGATITVAYFNVSDDIFYYVARVSRLGVVTRIGENVGFAPGLGLQAAAFDAANQLLHVCLGGAKAIVTFESKMGSAPRPQWWQKQFIVQTWAWSPV